MAKSSPFSFAFLSEILSSPRIKPLALRLHPATVFGATKGVFDDVAHELWMAANEQRRPNVNELIEKIVARLSSLVELTEPLVVDARGRIFPNDLERLADCAVQEAAWVLSEPQTEYSKRQDASREKDLRTRLARLGGAESALVFQNCEAARVAALQELVARRRKLVVARRDLYEAEDGRRLENAFDVFPTLERREIGACNAVSLEDYDVACDEQTGLVWRSFGRWSPDGPRPSSSEIATLKGAEGRNFEILGEFEFIPLLDLTEFFDAKTPTVADRLKTGFDLVLCDGAQLIGGPRCGVLFGSRARLNAIAKTPTAKIAGLDRIATAAFVKTLTLYESRAVAVESIPVLRLLATSRANLENRATRLAALLETTPCVQYARSIEGRSTLCVGASFGTSPTRLVELRPRGFAPAELAARLEAENPRLLARWNKDALLLDMKTIAPEQDVLVAELFERLTPPGETKNAL